MKQEESNSMNDIVTFNRVSKNVDGFQLGPIDLKFKRGFVTALVGSNGAGKSTLLKILMNLVKQDKGTVTLLGQRVDDTEDWKTNVAYMPQTYPGSLPFTGKELKNLIARWYPNWDERWFQYMLEQFQIPFEKKFEKLSQGVQQKLKFALTLARNPQLLILDEPTSHVDIPAKKLMIDLLIDWLEQEDSRTILLATHQVEDIRKLADYIVIMDDGKSLGKYEKDELIEQYKRYWIEGNLPTATVPGEIERENGALVTKCSAQTEEFLQKRGITWSSSVSLELDEVISIKLMKDKEVV